MIFQRNMINMLQPSQLSILHLVKIILMVNLFVVADEFGFKNIKITKRSPQNECHSYQKYVH